ncbi:MAG: S8 family serine peptidase [Luteimonas sp.]|nr:S8 family serine peptidase [Luteimonas sp.]
MRWIRHEVALLLITVVLPTAAHAQTSLPTKQIVRTQDDLPRFTYPVAGTASALLTADDATFSKFAAKVAANIEKTLGSHDIVDHATKRGLLMTLQSIAVLRGDDRVVLALASQIYELEDKPADKLLSRMRLKALIAARRKTGQATGEAFRTAYAAGYAESLSLLPWSVVGETIMNAKSAALRQTDQVITGSVATFMEPAVARSQQLSGDLARQLINSRVALKVWLPLRAETTAALKTYIAAHRVQKPDIWPEREVTLTSSQKLTPVTVAIWDEGTDLSLFPGQVFNDPHTHPRFDRHGLAFDMDFNPAHGELIPLTSEQALAYSTRLHDIQGESDVEQGIDSPAADALIEKIATLQAADVPKTIEELNFFGGYYAHGTHVAGIAARGNPAIRLAVARQNWDWRIVPAKPTEALIRRQVEAYATYVRWFRDHKVRVVNMSWGTGPAGYEGSLEANGIGKDADGRKATARQLFALDRAGLLAALRSAPEILFVAAAGNSNDDAGFNEDIPSSFELPNLITVGAVDQAGDATGFTSYGKSVRVYANGYQVESVVPGGARLRLSGTSMAAPAVVNLAAKMLAVEPSLTPPELISRIVDGSTRSADGKRLIINQRRSMRASAE